MISDKEMLSDCAMRMKQDDDNAEKEFQRVRLEDANSILLLDKLLADAGYTGERGERLVKMAADANMWRTWCNHERSIKDVFHERIRQILDEGYSAERDDSYRTGQLPLAAVAYVLNAPLSWPHGFDGDMFKPRDKRSNLVRAAALLLAEIDRIDRAEVKHAKANGK